MANPWNLTPREYDVMEVMATSGRGHFKLTAREMGLSPATIKTYLQRAVKRMKCRTRMEAVLLWDRHNRTCPQCFVARLKEQSKEAEHA